MIKIIKRTIDNKFLQSVDKDIWVDDIKEAFEMTYRECETAKTELFKTYQPAEIKEVVNLLKNKPITEEERKELLSIITRK